MLITKLKISIIIPSGRGNIMDNIINRIADDEYWLSISKKINYNEWERLQDDFVSTLMTFLDYPKTISTLVDNSNENVKYLLQLLREFINAYDLNFDAMMKEYTRIDLELQKVMLEICNSDTEAYKKILLAVSLNRVSRNLLFDLYKVVPDEFGSYVNNFGKEEIDFSQISPDDRNAYIFMFGEKYEVVLKRIQSIFKFHFYNMDDDVRDKLGRYVYSRALSSLTSEVNASKIEDDEKHKKL